MKTRVGAVLGVLFAVGTSGCSPRESPQSAAPADAPPASVSQPSVAAGAHKNDPAVVNFAGFGPAHFGDDEEHVRMAWGYPLVSGKPAAGSTCYYLAMDPPPDNGRGIRFMMDEGKFVRYDVDVPLHVAPGDVIVGDDGDVVRKAFAGRVDDQPHKYIEGGRTLTVSAPDGGAARLVFEIDAAGKISNWRIGVPPQVHYVEGCG
jgi:hypothetical protein